MVRVAADLGAKATGVALRGGVICLASGAFVATPDGLRRVEDLRPGEQVLTREAGAQEVLWAGRRRMTGARLFAMPHLRPVCLRAGAFGSDLPAADFCIAPRHRVLIQPGSGLVPAFDLVNGRSVRVDSTAREVLFVQILLARQHIVRVNGLHLETLPPARAAVDTLDASLHAALANACLSNRAVAAADICAVQRRLTGPEAVIVRYGFQ